MARNIGMAAARGEWLVFVDSDDALQPEALRTLDQAITDDIDAIGYDWRSLDDAESGGRSNGSLIEHGRDAIAQRYLRLQMDGSVIYTAVRRGLVADNGLKFEPGLHEDVDFIFEIYWLARRITLPPRVLYRKRQLYREERLQVRRRGGRKRALGSRAPMTIPAGPNQRWSLDFLSDQLSDSRRFRILAIVDDFTRECLALVADTSLSGARLARELDLIVAVRGQPAMIVSDNGTEMTSIAILRWSQEVQIEWH